MPFIWHVCVGGGEGVGHERREGGREGRTVEKVPKGRVFPINDFSFGPRAGMPSGTARINGTPKIVLAISVATQ